MARAVRDQGGISQMFNEDFHTCMFVCFLSQEEAKRVHQALKDPSWIEAMQKELLQFKMQKVWILVDLPYGKRAIGTKWVYRNKKDKRVARIEAIRLFLAYASFMGFLVYQMNVKSAFLYGTIEEEVYVCQPPGFEDPEYLDKVYKVVKALYGLHQASRDSYETLATYLLENRFQRGTIDQTLFIKKQQKDILLVKQKTDGIFISQDKYVAEILRKFGLSKGKSASTPIDAEKPLLKDSDGEDVDVHTYRVFNSPMLHVLRVEMVINSPWMLSKNWLVQMQTAFGVNTPRSDEDRRKLMELMVFVMKKGVCDEFELNATRLSKFLLSGKSVVKRSGDVIRLQALIDKKRIVITKEVVREILQLNDAEGQRFNFSKYIFESLVRNVDSSSKFYMHPYFIQLIIQTNIDDLSIHTNRYISPVLTQKVFANMRRVRKEEVSIDVIPPTPTSPSPSSPVLDTCSALVLRVEGLKNANAAQQLEIVKLKARVKKLEMLNKVKSSMLKRLKKDVEVEGRHADKQAEIYNIDLDHSSKVVAASTPIPAAKPKPKILKIAAALAVSTRRRKGVVIRNLEEELHTDTPAETPTMKDKGKGILIEDPKPMKKKDQVEMDAEYAKKLPEESDKEHEESYKNIDWNAALDHVQSKEPQYIKRYHGIKKKPQTESEACKNRIFYLKNTKEMEKEDEEIIKSINETPAQKAAKRRKLSEEAQEADDLRKRLEIVQDEDDDVFVEATLLAQKVPIVDYQIVVMDNKPKYKIIRADDTHQFYISFTTLLKYFNREDLKTLWRIVRDRFSTSKPTNFLDEYLLLTLKTMFEELDGQNAIWRNQKSVHGLALVKR
nr:hypothetical protein [Tanacetum cinerariifolium]